MKILISNKVNINSRTSDISLNFYGQTPLHLAIRNHQSIEVLELLISNGADINLKTYEKNRIPSMRNKSPLEFTNDQNIKNYLISKGAK